MGIDGISRSRHQTFANHFVYCFIVCVSVIIFSEIFLKNAQFLNSKGIKS